MSVYVLTEIVIGRPAGAVAAYAADPSNAPAWYQNITSVTWETSPPLQAGSKLTFTARFLGRRLAYTYEVTDFTPAERLIMRTSQGPFPMETTYTWQPAEAGSTRMTLRNRGEPAGFPRLVGPAAGQRHAARQPQGPSQAPRHPAGSVTAPGPPRMPGTGLADSRLRRSTPSMAVRRSRWPPRPASSGRRACPVGA